MKKPITVFEMLVRLIKILYQVVLPLTVWISLLIVSEKISRPPFSGSRLLDFTARLWLCLIFSMGYIIISDLEKYKTWFYGGKVGNLSPTTDVITTLWNMVMSVMLGIFAALISWWAVRTFLPIFNESAIVLASLNGIIFFVPMFYQRKSFRF